jgi:2-oxoglutarate ferredoxin oxidoreductase subunit gamma
VANTEIRITGLGGQGVVLSAYIIGRACAVEGGRHASMIQSFGPEARGSACSATLVVSDREVLYPYIKRAEILVAMSSEGYEKYADQLAEGGILIHEQDLVHPTPRPGQSVFSIPSTALAEALGKRVVQNIVMLGFVAAVTRIVPHDQMRTAVEASVPAGTQELNLRAFDAGWAWYEEQYGGKGEGAQAEVAATTPSAQA